MYLLPKGSIALDGVSLTINEVNADEIKLMLIPHTLAQTTLGQLEVGQRLNVEFDYLTRIVAHQLKIAGQLNEVETSMTNPFATIEQAIAALKVGRMIMLLDDENRENEGDLVIAAEHATSEAINFMSRFGRGLICLPMAEELIDKLKLPMMVANNRSPYGTAFTVSIEAANGVSTGISAKDRAQTIAVAISPEASSETIISPGHMFPLRAKPRGVLERAGQTEGSVDLARLAGLNLLQLFVKSLMKMEP